MMEAYLYKLTLNIPITKYDLTLKGNLGYNGEEEMINKIKNLDDGSIIVTSAIFQESKSSIIKTQASRKIYDYITKNLSLIGQFHKFRVYIKWWIDKTRKI